MNLIIDRGNTFIKIAVFENGKLLFRIREKKISDGQILKLINSFEIENVILSKVASINFNREIFSVVDYFIELNHSLNLPFQLHYKTPETLGHDRIASVAGAVSEFPNKPLLIIDTGTCIKVEFVDEKGNYLGGNICPGPELRYKAMHEGTAALPRVERNIELSYIGAKTEEALQIGGFMGCVVEIEGWISKAKEHFIDPIVVLSGGDASIFATFVKSEIFVRPDLVLTGLNKILELHVSNQN